MKYKTKKNKFQKNTKQKSFFFEDYESNQILDWESKKILTWKKKQT